MLRSETLFGKRDTNTPNSPFGANVTPPGAGVAGRTVPPGSQLASTPSSAAASHGGGSGNNEVGSKLIVGPNIKLKGVEINDCDTLVVEGFVEATMDSRVIQIAEKGAFKGSAGIDLAEIRGKFEGKLTVRQKLVVYATGEVTGTIRCGKLVIEEGGRISGDVQMLVEGRQAELGEVLNERPAKTAVA
ncbi:MAG: cell shape determination protein CcmA [Herbaspirillum sp.]|jgi:cytoskeletal protein CcmA (bactofilin family)|nr:cell shape determination protein CcmA [Herbaspirillum sp.]